VQGWIGKENRCIYMCIYIAALHTYMHHTYLSVLYILEPYDTHVTLDRYALTAEGLRVLACIAGSAIALVHLELIQYSF
jgi:hypothetical protein